MKQEVAEGFQGILSWACFDLESGGSVVQGWRCGAKYATPGTVYTTLMLHVWSKEERKGGKYNGKSKN